MEQCKKMIQQEIQTKMNKNMDINNAMRELSIVYNELGRLHIEIKLYNVALNCLNKSLELKNKIYGRYSIRLLSTLYNIINLLLNHPINPSNT